MFGIKIDRLVPLFFPCFQETVGIEFCGNNLKIARLKIFPARIEVANIISHNISVLSDIEISNLIRSFLKELGAKKLKIISMIPSRMMITKNIEIPSSNPQEIREIVNLQAARFTPYSRDEVIVDYINYGTYKHSYSKVLLIIVARNVVKRQFDILGKSGIKIENIVLASESLACFVPSLLKLATENAPAGIINIDDSFSDFIVVSRKMPSFIRSIPIGVEHFLGEMEKSKQRFVEELKKSFEVYKNENIGRMPGLLILTGAINKLKELEGILNNELQVPIKSMLYLENLTISNKVQTARPITERLSFLSVISSAFVWKELKINLTPVEVKVRRLLEEKGRELIKTGMSVLVIFVLVFFILINKIYFKNSRREELNAHYNLIHKEAEILESDFKKINLVKRYSLGRGYPLDILIELYKTTPIDLELNDIRFERNSKFAIRGTAETMATVFALVDNMEKSDWFSDVETRYTTNRKEKTRDVTDFEIRCLLNNE